jgi:lipoprotein NlpI
MLDPTYAAGYFARGRTHFAAGALAKAQADLKQARELEPNNAYYALWLDLAERRLHVRSDLAEAASRFDMTAWPGPVVRLLLGETTPAALLAATDDPDPDRKQGKLCEADFFSGEVALRDGADQEAARLFRRAVDDCAQTFFETTAAKAALEALGVRP